MIWTATLLALAAPPPDRPAIVAIAAAAVKIDEAAQQRLLDAAQTEVRAGRPATALVAAETVIAAYEAAYSPEKRRIYAARSMPETLYYMTLAATAGTDAIAITDQWPAAYYLKGFALIDLGRGAEAAAWFERAVALSPMNAQYLGEYAEWYKSGKDWERAYAMFERALGAAEFSPADAQSFDRRRAMRGMGFVRIEQGRLDEAQALFEKCLAIDPTDAAARRELDYIREQRPKVNPAPI